MSDLGHAPSRDVWPYLNHPASGTVEVSNVKRGPGAWSSDADADMH